MTQFQYLMDENAYIGSFKWSSFLCGRTFATFFKWRGFSRKRNIFFILTGDKQKQQKADKIESAEASRIIHQLVLYISKNYECC